MLDPLPVRYRAVDGTPVISVTQILTLAKRIDATWFTPESAWRGQVVHHLTEVIDRGKTPAIPVGLEGYVDAYELFLATVRPVYCDSEVEVVSPLYGLGGRIDRVCLDLLGGPGLLDFKTGLPSAWHGSQLAAYNLLRPTGARWVCYLRPNGRYKLHLYDDPIDHRRFMFDLAQQRGTVAPDGDHWTLAA